MELGQNNTHDTTSGGATAPDITAASFMEEVINASNTQPVVVDFWAGWSDQCKQLAPVLQAAVAKSGGAIKLVRVNIDAPENAALATQLKIQSVPTVYAFIAGQPVDGFAGPQPPAQVEAFIEKIAAAAGQGAGDAPNIDDLLAEAETALGAKNFEGAAMLYQEIMAAKPDETRAFAGLMRCMLGMGSHENAREMLDNMTDEIRNSDAVAAVEKMLELAEQAALSAGQLGAIEEKVQANPKDPAARFELGNALYGSGRTVEAMDALLESIRLDRNWNDAAARNQLLEIFNTLGPTAPEVIEARRKLSSMLFS